MAEHEVHGDKRARTPWSLPHPGARGEGLGSLQSWEAPSRGQWEEALHVDFKGGLRPGSPRKSEKA